jgi:hypothetical protein
MESTSPGFSKLSDAGLLVAVIEGKFCTNFAPFLCGCVTDDFLHLSHCPKPVAQLDREEFGPALRNTQNHLGPVSR